MTERLPFSQRYETRRPAEGLIYDRVPDRVKDGLCNTLDALTQDEAAYSAGLVARKLYAAVDRRAPSVAFFEHLSPAALVHQLEWDEFCDACQALWEIVRKQDRDPLSNVLNALFRRH
jgi:hypothetical protein